MLPSRLPRFRTIRACTTRSSSRTHFTLFNCAKGATRNTCENLIRCPCERTKEDPHPTTHDQTHRPSEQALVRRGGRRSVKSDGVRHPEGEGVGAHVLASRVYTKQVTQHHIKQRKVKPRQSVQFLLAHTNFNSMLLQAKRPHLHGLAEPEVMDRADPEIPGGMPQCVLHDLRKEVLHLHTKTTLFVATPTNCLSIERQAAKYSRVIKRDKRSLPSCWCPRCKAQRDQRPAARSSSSLSPRTRAPPSTGGGQRPPAQACKPALIPMNAGTRLCSSSSCNRTTDTCSPIVHISGGDVRGQRLRQRLHLPLHVPVEQLEHLVLPGCADSIEFGGSGDLRRNLQAQ